MKISVVIPVYNAEKYIKKCLDSIINQTYTDLEIILINDGSQDESGNICNEYAKKDSRIKVVHQKNQGVVFARINGFDLSTGDYISFIDADDWLELDTYKVIVNKLVDADILLYQTYDFKEGQLYKRESPNKIGIYETHASIEKEFLQYIVWRPDNIVGAGWGCLWNKLFRRELVESNIKYLNEKIWYAEDRLQNVCMFLDAKKIVVIDDYLYYYRKNDGQVSNRNDGIWENTLLLYEALSNVNKCKKTYDIDWQIKADLLGGAINSLRRECEQSSKRSLKEKMAFVKEVINHEDIRNALAYVDIENFTKHEKKYLWLIANKKIYLCFISLMFNKIFKYRR